MTSNMVFMALLYNWQLAASVAEREQQARAIGAAVALGSGSSGSSGSSSSGSFLTFLCLAGAARR